jgi:ubiquinone biosynthesis protein
VRLRVSPYRGASARANLRAQDIPLRERNSKDDSAVNNGRSEDDVAWSEFFDSIDFGALVPEAYHRFRPAIVDGLTYFLEHLSADRAFEILAEQALLPGGTSAQERLVAIARRCPALHKLGQVLARNHRLPLDFRRLLQSLESMPSTLETAQAKALVEAELGPLSALGIHIDEPPLAEASVAIVVPFTAPAETREEYRRGVLKLLKPDIEEHLLDELELLQQIGALLDERCEVYDLPRIDYEDTFIDVRSLLAREVHLDREQAHLRAARVAYADVASVVIPDVYAFSTPRLTAMQRIDGGKVTDVGTMPPPQRRKLAAELIKALVARPLWSRDDVSVFHADPHAGNLFVTTDGKLAILDWSLVGHLGKNERIQLSQILLGALTIDAARIRQAIIALAQADFDQAELDRVVDEQVRRLSGGVWPGMSWLTALMDDAVTRARCRFSGDFVIFRKVLQTLDGVVADVSPDCRPDWTLIRSFLGQLVTEWGQRAYAFPYSRHFATHFSNLDLTQLLASAPLIGSRQLTRLQPDSERTTDG